MPAILSDLGPHQFLAELSVSTFGNSQRFQARAGALRQAHSIGQSAAAATMDMLGETE